MINALDSILSNKYSNWELYFCDDSSPISGESILKDKFKNLPNKITYFNTNRSLEDKLRDGLRLGYYANLAMDQSEADIVIVLCDDDMLHCDYLNNINYFFSNNDLMYCYSCIDLYNPVEGLLPNGNIINKYYFCEPINPCGKLDISQVAWRMSCFKETKMTEETKIGNRPWLLDADWLWFEKLYEKFGLCHPTGFISQHKGIHDYQLVWHKKTTELGLKSYIRTVDHLAGDQI